MIVLIRRQRYRYFSKEQGVQRDFLARTRDPDPKSRIQAAVLAHRGQDMKNRFAILDVFDGFKDVHSGVVNNFMEITFQQQMRKS